MVFRHFLKNASNIFVNSLFFINDKSNEKYLQLTRINLKRIEKNTFRSKQAKIKSITF